MAAPSTDAPIDIHALQALLQGDIFAPWVRELALRVEQATPTEVVLALPIAPLHVHGGGVLCGQTMMAAADTAMVLAVSSALGEIEVTDPRGALAAHATTTYALL
jgi:acyl-coenzyme A thioesterase PaaI-like protein